ncbi:extracellular solute-binding protein [Halalkalibacter wakoensis JCM 9140]|uniref:Extracellular solute-binding protein n=1 Tax=Halalkalibacter wakoensis JCM 9140 TaxID=1236970 RepID=W4Q9L0_9BACI|nr:ABC transporter substrate-binding protein [Halalkalibacter wakoensis]GAE28074.1 extracellular solute-binding protein [Halalkalibacter wakoensis JCM 9140]
MYNKKAFREAGIEGEPETIEELISLGPKLKEAGYIPWTSGLNNASQATQIFDIMTPRHVTPEFFQQLLSKEVMDYTHPDMIAAFTTIQKMADELMAPGAAGVEDLEARSLFAQERAAMYSDGSWNLAPLREEVSEDFELGIMTYPLAREGNQRTTGFYDKLGIVALKDTGNEEWAKKFIAHVLSYEQQSRLGEISANTPVRNDIDADTLSETYSEDIVNTYNRAMEEGTHSLFNPIMPGEYRHAATQLIQGLVMKELTPEEFAEEFTQMVEDIHNR